MATYYKGDGTQVTIPDTSSVDTAQLVDNAVTYNKLAEAVQDQLGTSTEVEERLDAIEAELEEIESGGSGLTDGAKQALLNCFAHVAWIDEHGQDYYDALEDALYPPAALTSISCVYTQSGTVYDTDSLDDLRADLVVTAHYDNSTTQTVTTYTLSGTLAVGTSTVTVTYGGKTTTFNVTVSAEPTYVTNGLVHHWDGIDNTGNGHSYDTTTWKDLVGSVDLTKTDGTWLDNAISLSAVSDDKLYSDALESISDATIEVCFKYTGTNAVAFTSLNPASGTGNRNSRRVALFTDNTVNGIGASSNAYINPESSLGDIRCVSVDYTDLTVNKLYVNGVEASRGSATHSLQYNGTRVMAIGGAGNLYKFTGEIYAIRIYNRALTASEVAQNYALDVSRFELGA